MIEKESNTMVRRFLDSQEIQFLGPNVREQSLNLLHEVDATAAVEFLLEALKYRIKTFEDDFERRIEAARGNSTGYWDEDTAVDVVIDEARGDRQRFDEIEEKLSGLLLRVGTIQHVDLLRIVLILLKSLFRDKICVSPPIRDTLERIADKTNNRQVLIVILEQGDDIIAWHAARRLGKIEPDAVEAIPALKKKASNQVNNETWHEARDSIAKIQLSKV